MPMDITGEPSKWVCRLVCHFRTFQFVICPTLELGTQDVLFPPYIPTYANVTYCCTSASSPDPIFGTGFLVNIPFTQKYCILTAGHNVARPEEGRADRVEVFFPNGLAFVASASAGELFVSEAYAASPTLSDRDPSSISDYALVAVDRSRHRPPPTRDQALGGCSLSVLPSRSELLHTGGTVYGYSQGNVLQTKETSPFARPVQARYLEYEKDTKPGVSGGPIFISYNSGDVAIGIQYVPCLTCQVVRRSGNTT